MRLEVQLVAYQTQSPDQIWLKLYWFLLTPSLADATIGNTQDCPVHPVSSVLASTGSVSADLEAIEAAGEHSHGPSQYVDDKTTPCASIMALRAVLGPQDASASQRHARTYKAAFNYGPRKTGRLPMFCSLVQRMKIILL